MKKIVYIFSLMLIIGACKKDPEVQPLPEFSLPSDYSVLEGDENKTISIAVRSSGEFAEEGNPSVTYTIEHVSTDENDFTGAMSGTLEFTTVNETKYIELTTSANTDYEPTKQFTVRLGNGTNAKINKDKRKTTITFLDDDECICGECEGYETVSMYPGLTLDWSDEFDAADIDATIWDYDQGGGGWWNAQLQNFTTSPVNSFIKDGELVLKAIKTTNDYTSAQLKTQGKKLINRGRLDIRAKMPYGKGVWPRIWLKSEENVHGGWPKSGELIMTEVYGHIPSVAHAIADYGEEGNDYERKAYSYVTSHDNLGDCYHIFSMVWEADQISFLVDGNEYMKLTADEVTQKGYTYPYSDDADFHVIFSMAVGGTKVGQPNDSDLPAEMKIDYIRFYKED